MHNSSRQGTPVSITHIENIFSLAIYFFQLGKKKIVMQKIFFSQAKCFFSVRKTFLFRQNCKLVRDKTFLLIHFAFLSDKLTFLVQQNTFLVRQNASPTKCNLVRQINGK
jgi:hypothetical protein